MRVTFVVPAFPAGASMQDFWQFGLCQIHQARALAERGHDVTVIARYTVDDDTTRDGVRYRFVTDNGPPLLRSFQSSGPVIRAVKESSPDIVHAHGLGYPVLLNRIRYALGKGVPVLAEYHGETAPRFPFDHLQRSALRKVAGLIFANPARAERWREDLGLGPDRIFHVVECAPDRLFEDRHNARARTGFQGDPVILWNSRAIARRNPLLVVEGYDAYLHATANPRSQFYMMIPDHDPGVPQQIEAMCARSRKLRDHFTLIVGRKPQSCMSDYYNSADFILSGSEDDPFGYGVVDAMSCGVIPIVPGSPTFLDITDNGHVGLIWDVSRPSTLVEALNAMPDDRSLIQNMSREVLTLFSRRLSMSAQAIGLENAYATALQT